MLSNYMDLQTEEEDATYQTLTSGSGISKTTEPSNYLELQVAKKDAIYQAL